MLFSFLAQTSRSAETVRSIGGPAVGWRRSSPLFRAERFNPGSPQPVRYVGVFCVGCQGDIFGRPHDPAQDAIDQALESVRPTLPGKCDRRVDRRMRWRVEKQDLADTKPKGVARRGGRARQRTVETVVDDRVDLTQPAERGRDQIACERPVACFEPREPLVRVQNLVERPPPVSTSCRMVCARARAEGTISLAARFIAGP